MFENIIGATLNHKTFGNGKIMNIENNEKDANYYMFIDFNGVEKKLSFPLIMKNGFVFSDDENLNAFYVTAVEREDKHKEEIEEVKRLKRIELDEVQRRRDEFNSIRKNKSKKKGSVTPFGDNCHPDLVKMFHSPLTKDIEFDSDYNKYFAIGFIAAHADKIIADMSNDREDDFVSIFGDVDRNVIDYTDNRSVCQFNIEFNKKTVFPNMLAEAVCDVKYGKAYTIPRSRFVFDLVHDLGFQFGERQDISAIYDKVNDLGYEEAFTAGFSF